MAIIEVVKYDGSPNVFAWKYPNEELGTWTQLIVNESQEAVLFKGGKALDVFNSGKHTLETANIPIINNIINLPFGGRSPFTAAVWYINKTTAMDIKWGTTTPIQLQDPKYSIFVPIRSFGQFGIKIEDSKQFLVKLVGTLPLFDKANITNYFRGLYLTKVKDAISSYLVHKQISIMEINAYLEELSTHLQKKMQGILEEYGIKLVNFYVNDISVPEDDPAIKRLKEALAKKAEMNIIGFSYQQERSFNTLEGAAKNEGSAANLVGTGLGLGMGVTMGGAVGGQFGDMASSLNTKSFNTQTCPKCSSALISGKRFCVDCGFDTLSSSSTDDNSEISCSNCGTKYKNSMKFCPECGDKYNPCPKCGTDLDDGASVCKSCNYELFITCPHCNAHLSDKNVRFCSECGKSLVKACSKCNTTITGDSKFCHQCGNKLD